jgi:ribose transport system substrate-binding protein
MNRNFCGISARASGRRHDESRRTLSIAPVVRYNFVFMENAMRVRGAVLVAAACSMLVACSSSRHDPNEKYYLVAANIKVPYWQTAGAGLLRAAKDLNVAAEVVGPDNYDPNAEHEAFQRAIGHKPAGILVSATEVKLLQPDIDSAVQQGIPVISIDSDAPSSKRLLFIGTNNYQAGIMGGKLAVKLTNGKANVAIYTIPGQPNLEERLHGYKDAFAEHSGMKIIQVIDMKGDEGVAFDSTKSVIAGNNKPDAFICLEAIACKVVADVLNREHMTGKTVIAMDTDRGTLDWIQKGVISATIAQKPYTMAYFGVEVLDDVHHSKAPQQSGASNTFATLPEFVDTGTTLIDKDNVGEFIKSQDTATTGQKM